MLSFLHLTALCCISPSNLERCVPEQKSLRKVVSQCAEQVETRSSNQVRGISDDNGRQHPAIDDYRTTGPSRILCVDDDSALLTSLQLALEQHGFGVATAVHGLDAITQFREHPDAFDAIVTDHEMVEMGGLDLVRALREEGFSGHIVVLSGNMSAKQFRAYQKYPINGFVQKPFHVHVLVKVLLDADSNTHQA
jgi:CheY-like chemotaxis protein